MEVMHLPVAHRPEGTYVEVRPGMSVILQTATGASVHEYRTIIEEIGQGSVTVLAPMDRRQYRRLTHGQKVVVYFREDGRGYRFDTAVLGTQDVSQPLVRLEAPIVAYRHERREYYRVPIALKPLEAMLANAAGEPVRPLDAVVVDISGGGMQFTDPHPLAPGARVRFTLPLDGLGAPVAVVAKVVNVHQPEEGRSLYRFNARFEGLRESERQRLVRYVFRQQIALRKKGLL